MKSNSKWFLQFSLCLSGLGFASVGYVYWLIPFNVSIGGFTGLGTVLNAIANIPFWLSSTIMNSGLFIYAWKKKGKGFVIKSIVATLALSFLLDYVPPANAPLWGLNRIQSAVWGSMIAGIGFGLILKGGFSTGGSDCLAEILHSIFPKLSVGIIMTLFDLAVIILSGVAYGFDDFILWLFAMTASNIALDCVLYIDRLSEHPASKVIRTIYFIFESKIGAHGSNANPNGLAGPA